LPDPAREADVTAIVVTYNPGDRLGTLLAMLEREVREMVVVDNSSTDGSLAGVRGGGKLRMVRNRENRGFAAAANQGAALARTEWVLFVNPDVHLQPGQPTLLVQRLPEDVAAVAPLQLDQEGRPRSESGGYEPTLARYAALAVLPSRLRARWGPWLGPPLPSTDTTVDWVSGAMLAVRRRVFEAIGGFDERFFFSLEDVDLGRRIRSAGYRSLLRPSVRVHHEVAQDDPERRLHNSLLALESLAQYFQGWRRRALALVMALGSTLRALAGSETQRALGRAALPRWLGVALTGLPSEAGRRAATGRSASST
jgi:N-acetylglucosaminyl-diphospho-decaprenol L-rhamnosyltransferase